MTYNHAQEVAEWKRKKQAEEAILREHGISGESITELRESDWAEFKSERIFHLHNIQSFDENASMNISTVEALLNEIQDTVL